MLCEDALLFQYWDVKLHTGLLMHSGNHSLLLRLPARKLSVDPVTGEGGSDSLSLSLFFDQDFLSVIHCHCVSPPPPCPPSISPVFLGGVSLPRAPWQGRLMRRPQFSDSWHLPGDSPWHAHVVGFMANKQTSRQLETPQKRRGEIASLNNLLNLSEQLFEPFPSDTSNVPKFTTGHVLYILLSCVCFQQG